MLKYPGKDEWRPGLRLPYGALFPGEFISHGNTLLSSVGYKRNDIYQLNREGDGWMFVSILQLFSNIM